jgi:hypothetical protein
MGMVYNVAKKKVMSCLKEMRRKNGDVRDEQVEELLMKTIQEVHLSILANRYVLHS